MYYFSQIGDTIHFNMRAPRALQLHPNKPALFILAASHELDHHSPSAARMLLQRGIRLNPESMDMWKEYVKMELGFIESLRRRWDVLGIKVPEEAQKNTGDPGGEMLGEEYEGDAGAAARRKVMEGAIVESVISSAARGMCRAFFTCVADGRLLPSDPTAGAV